MADLIARGGILYLLSTRDGGAAPLLTMLADHVVTAAMRASQSQSGQRLDPPVRLVLDEAGTIAPLPKLPELMADSGGRGITTCAFFQTFSQMRHRRGREGADAIYAIATTRLVLGGIGEDEDLRRLSTLVGEHRVRRQSTSRNRGRGDGGSSTSTTSSYDWEPVLRPAQIRELPEGQALMFYRNRKAAVMRLRGLWQCTDWAALQQNKAHAEARSQPRVAA